MKTLFYTIILAMMFNSCKKWELLYTSSEGFNTSHSYNFDQNIEFSIDRFNDSTLSLRYLDEDAYLGNDLEPGDTIFTLSFIKASNYEMKGEKELFTLFFINSIFRPVSTIIQYSNSSHLQIKRTLADRWVYIRFFNDDDTFYWKLHKAKNRNEWFFPTVPLYFHNTH